MSSQGVLVSIILLASVIIGFILNTIAEILNLSALDTQLPDAFKGHYDEEKYKKSQDYLKACTTFGWITTGIDLIIFLLFWFCKGFALLDIWVRSLEFGAVMTGLIYMGTLILLKGIISLPFSIYATFGIEARFGFNKTTPSLFIKDLIKSVTIGTIIGGILLGGILLFLETAGPWAWLICWAISTTFALILQYIVPTWIMPLFNKFTPLEEGARKETIVSYANTIDFPLRHIFVMDGSKRSTKANAFFTGFGKNRRIVLFDTLIKNYTPHELLAVIAHEMGHYKKKHIPRRLAIGILQMGVIFYLISIFITYQGLFDAFFMESPSIYAGLIFFSLLFSPVDMVISIIMQHFSRTDEYEADRFAVETSGEKAAMVTALKKLSVQNLSNLRPHPFYVWLNYSHPPILERLKAIEAL